MLRFGIRSTSIQLARVSTRSLYTRSLIHGGFLSTRPQWRGSGMTMIPSGTYSQMQHLRFKSTSAKDEKDNKEVKEESNKPGVVAPAEDQKKLTLWQKVKHEAQHYWDGTKLLGYEIKVSTKLAAKMAAGYDLTRREDRQLRRTTQDIIRLIPFSMFVIVPFAELLIPVVMRIFPNFLPSTYESRTDKEKKNKKLRKTRGNVSTFLRQTVDESGMVFPVIVKPEQREQFTKFFRQVRTSGEHPSQSLLVSVARLFKDDIVLDNLSRPQLVAMAKYLNLQPFGTNVMLRYSIRYKLRQVKRDDAAIEYEGVESLSVPELQNACSSRGIKTYSVSPGKLRDDLNTWLELRLQQKVPSTLLLLSSAYNYGEVENSADSYYDGLLAVLSALPEELYHEAELELAPKEATNKQRLEVLKEQEELIKDENEQEVESGHVIKVRDNINIDDDHGHHAEASEEAKKEAADVEAANQAIAAGANAQEVNDSLTSHELEKKQASIRQPIAPQDSTEYEPTPEELEKREEAFRAPLAPQDSTEYEPTPEELEKREEAFRAPLHPQDSLETDPTPEELEKREEAFRAPLHPQDSLETDPTPEELKKRDEAHKPAPQPQDSTESEPTTEDLKKRDEVHRAGSSKLNNVNVGPQVFGETKSKEFASTTSPKL